MFLCTVHEHIILPKGTKVQHFDPPPQKKFCVTAPDPCSSRRPPTPTPFLFLVSALWLLIILLHSLATVGGFESLAWISSFFTVSCCVFNAGVEFQPGSRDKVTKRQRNARPKAHICTICDKRFSAKGLLEDHLSVHSGKSLYACTQCEKHFTSHIRLNSHMNVHSNKYRCSECGKKCHTNRSLAVHRRIHSGEKPFECNVCCKRFTASSGLVLHNRIHSGENPYKCHVCEKSFKHASDLYCHMRLHTGEKPYKCDVCQAVFRLSGGLHSHMRVHTGQKPYICRTCSKAFSQRAHLRTHTRVHTGEKPYKCPTCDKVFSQSSHMQLHIRVAHNNIKPYYCRFCGLRCSTKQKLTLHIPVHTGTKLYSCKHCSSSFRNHHQLKQHRLESHNEGSWFKCPFCAKKFLYRSFCKTHLLHHEGFKPYICAECPMRFYSAAELREHQSVHLDYKPFICGLCNRLFKRKSTVRLHFKKCCTVLQLNLGWFNFFSVVGFSVLKSRVSTTPGNLLEFGNAPEYTGHLLGFSSLSGFYKTMWCVVWSMTNTTFSYVCTVLFYIYIHPVIRTIQHIASIDTLNNIYI